jgi:hypothetical protein
MPAGGWPKETLRRGALPDCRERYGPSKHLSETAHSLFPRKLSGSSHSLRHFTGRFLSAPVSMQICTFVLVFLLGFSVIIGYIVEDRRSRRSVSVGPLGSCTVVNRCLIIICYLVPEYAVVVVATWR